MTAALLVPNVVFASVNNPRDLSGEERESGFYQ
jgi:hypothetical protein